LGLLLNFKTVLLFPLKIQPMKNLYLLLITAFICVIVSCKKEKASTDDSKTASNSVSIITNYEYNGIWQRKGYMMLDINHDDNKDKKFLIFDIENRVGGGYQFVIKRGPLPIDSLATNWPKQVKTIFNGYSNDMYVDQYMRMQATNVSAGSRFTYVYDSMQKFSGNSILMLNYLHNASLYAGSMASKLPQAKVLLWEGDATGTSKPKDVIYYFKEGHFTNVTSVGNGANLLTTFQNGFNVPSERWKKMDAVITLEGTFYTHFYFDFDEWQYFTIKDFCPSTWGAPCTAGLQTADFQSMDNLMTWPIGFGKK
jgi:hypothetical protein